MNESPLDRLRAVFGEQLQELAGTVVTGEVPLTTPVVNGLIAQKLATTSAPIAAARIETHPREAFTVHLRPKGPWPLLRVEAAIDQQPDMPANPVLGIRWSLRGLGALAALAAPFLAQFRTLPPGITLDRDHIYVNLQALLRAQGYAELLPLVTGIRVLTREGGFVVQFEVRR